MLFRRLILALLPLSLSGCGLASLPYHTARAVVDPDHERRAETDRRVGRDVRRREAREYRAYVRCRDQGYPDC